jgi:hypothetical protein
MDWLGVLRVAVDGMVYSDTLTKTPALAKPAYRHECCYEKEGYLQSMRAIPTALDRERLSRPPRGRTECSPGDCWRHGLLRVGTLIKTSYDELAKPAYCHYWGLLLQQVRRQRGTCSALCADANNTAMRTRTRDHQLHYR